MSATQASRGVRRRALGVAGGVLGAAAFLLPIPLAGPVRDERLACFDTLVARRAPLADFERAFGPHSFASAGRDGSVLYGYRLTSRIDAAVALGPDGMKAMGKDLPDTFTLWGELRSRYTDVWAALRRAGADCR